MPSVNKWVGDAMESLMASKLPLMKVMEVNYINPSIKKIRFKGDLSHMNFKLGYAVVIRVSNTEFRNYTSSFSDVEAGIFEIIFYLHGSTPGCVFIADLKVGDELRISMPRGLKYYDPSLKQYLVFGDETSLSLAVAFQPFLKKNRHQFQFYLELDERNANVPKLLGLENYKVFSKTGTFNNEPWINDLPIFKTPDWQSGCFILTGNVKSVQNFRKIVKNNKLSGRIFTKGFWLKGKTGL